MNWQQRMQALGPGILMATAAIGGSHIVASTQAGALFGWQLALLILLVNLLKYPFFRFGVDYSLQTGETLLVGYRRQHKLVLISFFVLNILSAVVNTAGVLILTGALLQYFIPFELSLTSLCVLLLVSCLALLLAGQYKALDRLSKYVMVILTITTVSAALIAATKGAQMPANFVGPSPWQLAFLGFLVALMGWMPAPIEISAINSMWLKAKQRQHVVSRDAGLFDFHLGYISTAILAVVFLALGALVQYGSAQPVSMAGGAYIDQFVKMYAQTIGQWSTLLVAVIAFLCMFGTTLTVLDGYARTNNESAFLLKLQTTDTQTTYNLWLLVQAVCGLVLILFFKSSLAAMLTFAMTMAFLTTPVFAFLNYRLMRAHASMSNWLKWLSWLGLTYLLGFALLYLWWLQR